MPVVDGQAAATFIQSLAADAQEAGSLEANVLARMEAAHFRLLHGDLDSTRITMRECEAILDSLDTVDRTVHAAFYRVAGDYYKVRCGIARSS